MTQRPGVATARGRFVYIAQRTVCRKAGAMNRAPTSLTAGIRYRRLPAQVADGVLPHGLARVVSTGEVQTRSPPGGVPRSFEQVCQADESDCESL